MTEQVKGAEHSERILVIDDEEIVHASVGKILRRAGYSTESVYSADQGLERLREQPYDLVITDLMMPGMNGVELLRALRKEQLRATVIMITGYPTIRTALQAMRLGAMDYLAKPFTRKELLAPVLRALRQESVAEEEAGAAGTEAELELSDLLPGNMVYLPHHAWAQFLQDGHFLVGVEASFLGAVGEVMAVQLPESGDQLEQGRTGIQVISGTGEEHAVAMPLSGQVVELNEEVSREPACASADCWCLKVLPSDLKGELKNLVLRK